MGNYISIADVRKEGITATQATDDEVTTAIEATELDFEAFCRRWFYKRDSYTLTIDGGTRYTLASFEVGMSEELCFPVPIIALTSIRIHGVLKNQSDFIVYNRIGAPNDDRFDPRIISKNCEWPTDGLQNIEIMGSFGFVNPAPDYTTPVQVKNAVRRLTALNLLTGHDKWLLQNEYRITEEQTSGYKYKMARPYGKQLEEFSGFTGDKMVDDVIELYRYKRYSESV